MKKTYGSNYRLIASYALMDLLWMLDIESVGNHWYHRPKVRAYLIRYTGEDRI